MGGQVGGNRFPNNVLQFGGSFPAEWGDPDFIEMDCLDKWNLVTIEPKRIREYA